MKIFVDGCEYYVDSNVGGLYVYDIKGRLVGYADIDDNVEQIGIEWHDAEGERDYGSYPYFEYGGDDEELARWIVSCAPWV